MGASQTKKTNADIINRTIAYAILKNAENFQQSSCSVTMDENLINAIALAVQQEMQWNDIALEHDTIKNIIKKNLTIHNIVAACIMGGVESTGIAKRLLGSNAASAAHRRKVVALPAYVRK
jgi:hypothetical protein